MEHVDSQKNSRAQAANVRQAWREAEGIISRKLNRQSRNHRPPIQVEGLVKMTWVGLGSSFSLVGWPLVVRNWWCGAGGEELVARMVVRLVFLVFLTFLAILSMKNHPKSLKTPNWRKKSKNVKNMTKTRPPSFGSWGPKVAKNISFLRPQKSLKKYIPQKSYLGGHLLYLFDFFLKK